MGQLTTCRDTTRQAPVSPQAESTPECRLRIRTGQDELESGIPRPSCRCQGLSDDGPPLLERRPARIAEVDLVVLLLPAIELATGFADVRMGCRRLQHCLPIDVLIEEVSSGVQS